jgi:hypothetical protein
MVGPLDTQIVINQSAATEKVQEVQQRHPDLQQRHFALQLEEEREKVQRDVKNSEKLDQAVIRHKEKGEEKPGKRKRPRRGRSQKDENPTDEKDTGEDPGVRIDVFV